MTTTAKGVARKRAAARSSKVARNEQRVAEVKRDEETGNKPTARNPKPRPVKRAAPAAPVAKKATPKKRVPETKPVAKKAATKTAPATSQSWDKEASLGSNTDRLKNAGVTWRAIAEMANANGVEMPWPDGGKLLRARKQFLAGTEGQVKPTTRRAPGTRKVKDPDDDRSYAEQAAERLAAAQASRNVPWDDESTDEELLAFLDGKAIEFVSAVSGNTSDARIIKGSKHNQIRHGKDGPYITFPSMDGPFLNISLSRIIRVSG